MMVVMLYNQSELCTHFDSFYLSPLCLYKTLQAVSEFYFLFVACITERPWEFVALTATPSTRKSWH
jgi:hypothetical protein